MSVDRRALVAAVGEQLGIRPQYLGPPTFAYRIGSCTISKDGMLDSGDMDETEVSTLVAALKERGFIPSEESNDSESLAVISIDYPDTDISDATLDNIRKLVAGKATLIRMALGSNLAEGAEALPVTRENGMIRFPWLRFGIEADAIAAWSMFVSALCETAKRQKRVNLKEKVMEENSSPKFLFRCFLLKLGFIGDDTKEARRILLAGLSGNGSYAKHQGQRSKTKI